MEVPLKLSRRTIAFRRADPVGKEGKKRLHLIAAIANVLLLSSFCNASAADPYDGQWNGSATATAGRCRPVAVTITVSDKVGIGQVRFPRGTQDIRGTLTNEGMFGATIGFERLTGTFARDMFEGSFKHEDCVWKIVLKRTK